MLFASDLDRTLIYSSGFIQDIKDKESIQLIETKEDQPISYMTRQAVDLLKEISKCLLFIPTTTRTITQYKRIKIFQQEIKSKYAIVSNGGNILYNGNVDEDWKKRIKSLFLNESYQLSDVLNQFNEIKGNWVLRSHTADDMFGYLIVDEEKIPHNELKGFKDWAHNINWKISLQGRKLYLIPEYICKGKAVEYIAERENKSTILAAGDSLLDLPMLEKAHYAITPVHGELYKNVDIQTIKHISVAANEGILAAEEILKEILFQINK
ncbi:MAG: HAD hydrolase family protein [Clostridia bacterium]|nr:HAD hydrolase family protein [Clostridia bacterium]